MHLIYYKYEQLPSDEIQKLLTESASQTYTCSYVKLKKLKVLNPQHQKRAIHVSSSQITLPKTLHLSDVSAILHDELIDREPYCHVCDLTMNNDGMPC